MVVTALLVLPLIVLASTSGSVDDILFVVTAIALLGILAEVVTASDVRASCGPQGVSVHWGAFGWPRARYALGDIAGASVVQIPWWAVSYGFWWTPTVTITVPDPHAAVAVLRPA